MSITNNEQDEVGLCIYMRRPYGGYDQVPSTRAQCYSTYGGTNSEYVVIAWIPPNEVLPADRQNLLAKSTNRR